MKTRPRPSLYVSLTACLSLFLAACGGGSSSDSSGGGSGQAPDPVVVDLPIAYIQRPLPRDDNGELVFPRILEPAEFHPGAALYIKDRATALATPINITDQAFVDPDSDDTQDDRPLYDVRDLSVHPAGDRLLFAMRAPAVPNADDDEQPRWNIWEYHLTLKSLRRVITSDIVAEAGDDLSPRYLPDDRIVFTSTRQTRSRAILLDDNKPQYSALEEGRTVPAFNLHVMENDGTNIQQLSYNQSHDLYPLVLQDGRILYTRWDNMGRRSPVAPDNRLSFYTLRPDGSEQAFHYGYHSLMPEPGSNTSPRRLFRPQQLPDGRIVAIDMPDGELLGGDMRVIDTANFTEREVTLDNRSGQAESSLSILPIVLDGAPSPHGLFASLHPLYDGTNRLLVSWSQCRLQDPATARLLPCTPEWLATEGIEQALPFFGLWIYNLDDQTQQPVVLAQNDVMFTEAVTLEPRPAPTYLPATLNPDWQEEGVGVLHIRSVYDTDGVDTTLPAGIATLADPMQRTADQRPARFLRITKAVSMPDRDTLTFPNSAFGFSAVMREIIGYVPIEPDGSVKVKIPADIAFSFEITDARGQRLASALGNHHPNWLQLRAGEERQCQGCHAANSTVPHGRPDAGVPSINYGAATTGLPFPNTNPALFADMGETMAEVYARINGVRKPSVDLVFNDAWTDPNLRPLDTEFAYRYLDLADIGAELHAPTTSGCFEPEGWSSLCRIIINYPQHIQPVWERVRRTFDEEGILIAEHTCTACHSPSDADNMVQVPAGQLDLTRAPHVNQNAHMTSYRELLAGDVEQEIVNGVLIDRLIPSGRFEEDEEGELILAAEVNPIPILVSVSVGRSMVPGSARNSGRFFNTFTSFNEATQTVDHRGYLNGAEMKLLSEWLDLGAAYYNNPFDSVAQD